MKNTHKDKDKNLEKNICINMAEIFAEQENKKDDLFIELKQFRTILDEILKKQDYFEKFRNNKKIQKSLRDLLNNFKTIME